MINPTLEKALHAQLDQLPLDQQRQVLEFACTLATTQVRGVPGSILGHFAGTIEPDDLVTMAQAIEAGCEQVNPDEW